MRALLAVIVLAAVALVYVARSGNGRATDSAVAGGVTGWTGFIQVAVSVPRTASAEERRGFLAGCHAAMG
jgi:hypothetical protein